MSAALCFALFIAAPPDELLPEYTPAELEAERRLFERMNRRGVTELPWSPDLNRVRRLGPSARAAVPAILDFAADFYRRDDFVPMSVGDALGAVGPDAIPALIDAVRSDDEALREYAWIGLWELRFETDLSDPALIGALFKAIGDELRADPPADAERALSHLETLNYLTWTPAPVADVLIDLLGHPNVRVRREAARTLELAVGRGRDLAPHVPALRTALRTESDRHVQSTLRWTLADMGAAGDLVVPWLLAKVRGEKAGGPPLTDGCDIARALFALNRYPEAEEEARAAIEPRADELLRWGGEDLTDALRSGRRGCGCGSEGNATLSTAFGLAAAAGRRVDAALSGDDADEQLEAIRTLAAFGRAAAGEAERLLPLVAQWPQPRAVEALGQFSFFKPNPSDEAVAALARIAPGHPALAERVFSSLPDPAELPEEPPAASPEVERLLKLLDEAGSFPREPILTERQAATVETWEAKVDAWENRRADLCDRLQRICWTLGEMGPHAAPAVPKLLPVMEDGPCGSPAEAVVNAVAAAGPLPDAALAPFARLAGQPTILAPMAGVAAGYGTHEALLAAGPRAIPPLVEAFDAVPTPPTPADAAVALVAESDWYGPNPDAEYVSERLDELRDARRAELEERLRLFARFGPLPPAMADDVLWAVAPLVEDEELDVRRLTINVISETGPTGDLAVPVLLTAAEAADPRVRAEAVRALAAYGDDAGVRAALAAALQDDYATVRLPAIRAWRVAGFEEERLAPLRDDPNPAVRFAANEE